VDCRNPKKEEEAPETFAHAVFRASSSEYVGIEIDIDACCELS